MSLKNTWKNLWHLFNLNHIHMSQDKQSIKLATHNDHIPFDKAIQEINGIIKLAGLT